MTKVSIGAKCYERTEGRSDHNYIMQIPAFNNNINVRSNAALAEK